MPVKIVVFVLFFVTEPVPPMSLATVTASLRLNTSEALSVTAPVPSVPAVPPLPICRVPEEIVVVPL